MQYWAHSQFARCITLCHIPHSKVSDIKRISHFRGIYINLSIAFNKLISHSLCLLSHSMVILVSDFPFHGAYWYLIPFHDDTLMITHFPLSRVHYRYRMFLSLVGIFVLFSITAGFVLLKSEGCKYVVVYGDTLLFLFSRTFQKRFLGSS